MAQPTIRTRAYIAFGLLLLAGMASAILAHTMVSAVDRISQTLSSGNQFYGVARRIAATVATRDAEDHTSEALLVALDKDLAAMSMPDAAPPGDKLPRHWQDLLKDWTEQLAAYRTWRQDATPENRRRLDFASEELRASVVLVYDSASLELSRHKDRQRITIYVLGTLDVLMVVAVTLGMRRYILAPLAALADAARDVRPQQYSGQFASDAPDEIGELSRALHRSATQVGELIHQVTSDAEAIRQGELRFRTLVENAGVGVYLIQHTRYDYVNSEFARMLGYTREELTGSNAGLELIDPADRERVGSLVVSCLRGQLPSIQYECNALRKDGSPVACASYASAIEMGGRRFLIGTAVDLSNRKASEERLRRLSQAIEQSPAVVVITDRQGRIEYVNPRFTQLTGYTAEEALGNTPRVLRSGKTDPSVYREMWERLLAGEQWSGEILNRKKSGEHFWEQMTASAVRNESGEITHFIAVKEDITGRKLAEREFQRLNRTLRVMSESNQALVHAADEAELLSAACRNIVELGGYEVAYIGMADDATARRVRMVARYGNDGGYLDVWTDEQRGRGSIGESIRTGQVQIMRNMQVGAVTPLAAQQALAYGFSSAVALPMINEGVILGSIRILSRDCDNFTDHDVKLLSELAADLAYGIVSLRNREERRRTQALLRDSEERFRTISASARDGIIMFNAAGLITYWNPAAEKMSGLAGADLVGKTTVDCFLSPDLLAQLSDDLGRAAAEEACHTIGRTLESTAIRHDGNRFPVEVSTSAALLGGEWQVVVLARDISARKLAEEMLAVRTRAVESSTQAIVIAKSDRVADNPIIYVNPAFEEVTGYNRDEVIGRPPRLLLRDDLDQPGVERLRDALRRSVPTRVRLRNYRKDGTVFWSELSLGPVKDDAGQLTHVVGIIDDITQRVRAEEELRHRATHDALTGLANRVLLLDRIQQAVAHAARAGRFVAVMLLDLDRFKIINDSLGHGVGDLVVKTVGERLRACMRRGDTVARLGGDEFVVVLAGLKAPSEAAVVADKIQQAITLPIQLDDRQLYVAASIGASFAPGDGVGAEVLLKNADVAMYSAKSHGGGAYRTYSAEMNANAVERLSMEGDLRRAVEHDEFVLHYQPKIDLATGMITGAEALIRWQDPKRGMVPPMDFIPLAEETGLIVQIGEWALRAACRTLHAWQDLGLGRLNMAVNISARQFRQPSLARSVEAAVRDAGLAAEDVELELTESMIMHNAEATHATLSELKATGVRLAIDDFGTGYSSLSYLRSFPVDTLKIDRSFVSDVEANDECRTIASAVIMLAHGLGMQVVAEGVETDGQAAFLLGHGCDAVQGYLYSRPLDEKSFVDFLRAARRGAAPSFGPLRLATSVIANAK